MLILLFSVFAFLTGVLLGTFVDTGFWIFCFALPLFIWPRWSLIFLGFMLGMWRVDLYEASLPSGQPFGEWVELKAQVVEEVDRRQDNQRVTIDTEWGRVIVTMRPYESLEYGDELIVAGVLEKAAHEKDFSYRKYLERYRVGAIMSRAHLKSQIKGKASFRRALYFWKTRLEAKLNRLFYEPEASFAAGLLLGSRKGMPESLALAFQRTGLTHIIAISGYNISLVIAGMFLLLGFLPLKSRIVVSIMAIVLFVLLVGASAAVVRAGIMGILTLVGLYGGRKSQVFFALLWSATLMVLINPYTLVYDVGFQLSFASTFGLLVFVPILNSSIPLKEGVLKEAFTLTLAAQVATLPFMAFHFGRLSLVSPLTNVLVAPFLPLAMGFSALALIGGELFALLASVHLKAVQWIALFFNSLPFIEIPFSFSIFEFVLSLTFLVWISCQFYRYELARAFAFDLEGDVFHALTQGSQKHEKQ